MNCYNYNCPFRVNKITNVYCCEYICRPNCECISCPNRTDGYIVHTTNCILSADEIARIKNKDNPDDGVGVYS